MRKPPFAQHSKYRIAPDQMHLGRNFHRAPPRQDVDLVPAVGQPTNQPYGRAFGAAPTRVEFFDGDGDAHRASKLAKTLCGSDGMSIGEAMPSLLKRADAFWRETTAGMRVLPDFLIIGAPRSG